MLSAAHTILQRRILITGNQLCGEDLKGSGQDTISGTVWNCLQTNSV